MISRPKRIVAELIRGLPQFPKPMPLVPLLTACDSKSNRMTIHFSWTPFWLLRLNSSRHAVGFQLRSYNPPGFRALGLRIGGLENPRETGSLQRARSNPEIGADLAETSRSTLCAYFHRHCLSKGSRRGHRRSG